ncbi:capsid and scaffold protein [Staphylococcus phage vB_SsapH-Golestan101-M]|nr:capsid and scaffold protein [Staphylococcus phage vB_SsapH-Golestan101-M]
MAFEFNSLTEKQYLSDMTKEVNRVGDYLKNELTREEVETIASPDFEDILKYINVTGSYYVTSSKNQPPGENWNGFVFFEKRLNNYYKIYYSPFNNNNLYVKTLINGTLTDWKKFVLDEETNNWQKYKFTNEQGQYTTQEDVDIRELNNSKTIYVKNLVDPPKHELNEGWLDTKVHENGNTSITTFNPINSTTTYTKMQKRAREVQNPNLLKDALFEEAQHYMVPWGDRVNDEFTWDTTASGDTKVTTEKTLYGNKTVKITNEGTATYPIVRSGGLEIGKDVTSGENLTFSVYLFVPDKAKMQENNFYIQITKYADTLKDINNSLSTTSVFKDDIKEGEWNKITVTAKVPSSTEVKYISCVMRIDTNNSGTKTGMVGYYALPKLEKGDKATPFITHVDDKKQFDEIYTNWLENPDEQSVLNNYSTDINNNNYFKYQFWKSEVGNMTLQDLLQTLPQGFHTFYAQGGIEGVPRGRSIRGTAQVDYDKGDVTSDNKFINVNFNDSNGLRYSLYYGGYNYGWYPLRNHEIATYLWDGSFDLGVTDSKIELNDDYRNYEYLELLYWTSASGHEKTVKIRTGTTNTFYIRDFNLTNDATGTGFTAFESYFRIDDSKPKIAVAEMMKELGVTSQIVNYYNNSNRVHIKRVTGINTL